MGMLRLEGGITGPLGPEVFKTRYDSSVSVRAVGDGPFGDHLCLRMSTAYSSFTHARLPTYVRDGGAWYLGSAWGLSVWPLHPTARIRPYVAGGLAFSGFQIKDVVIDTGGGPHTIRGAYASGLSHALEAGVTLFPGSGRVGASLAAERVTVHDTEPSTHFMSYTAGIAYRLGRWR